jgi:hypothetical protein
MQLSCEEINKSFMSHLTIAHWSGDGSLCVKTYRILGQIHFFAMLRIPTASYQQFTKSIETFSFITTARNT